MASRASNREEEFELVLGNKQLLSLFFIVVGFFAAFFSVGYMVGYGHGEKTGAESGMARVEEPAPKPAEPRLPATLMQDPQPAPPPAVPAETASKPSPVSEPTPAPAAKPTPNPPAKPSPAAAPAPSSGTYYLQVAAVRVEADAAQLAGQLKSKGYPASVNAGGNDGWQRVVVGPFNSAEAASSFKEKLTKDGFDTMLRKL